MKAHLLFEQSGTFKREFQKLGIAAYDYDILNDFNETDYVIDLFQEISKAYSNETSIFDNFNPEDIIFAFFPCIRFEDQILLGFRGEMWQMRNWSQEKKLEYDLKLHDELHQLYDLVTKLSIIAIRKNLRLVIENPYSVQHYLGRYWSLKPTIIDKDRTENGDYFRKPTMYFCIGFNPSNNEILESANYNKVGAIEHIAKCKINGKSGKVSRSMIHPEYANRFIRRYIL